MIPSQAQGARYRVSGFALAPLAFVCALVGYFLVYIFATSFWNGNVDSACRPLEVRNSLNDIILAVTVKRVAQVSEETMDLNSVGILKEDGNF